MIQNLLNTQQKQLIYKENNKMNKKEFLERIQLEFDRRNDIKGHKPKESLYTDMEGINKQIDESEKNSVLIFFLGINPEKDYTIMKGTGLIKEDQYTIL